MLDRYQEVAQAAGTWSKALWLVDFYGKAEKTYGKSIFLHGKSMGNLWEIYISTVMDVMAIKIRYTLWL